MKMVRSQHTFEPYRSLHMHFACQPKIQNSSGYDRAIERNLVLYLMVMNNTNMKPLPGRLAVE